MTPGACLLDTHVVLWLLTDPNRLSKRAHGILAGRGQPLLASAGSAWELATKHRLGKLPQADALLHAYSQHLARAGIEDLPITSGHSLMAGSLDWGHRDPFDRLLAAQAMTESLPLVTADRAFTGLPGIRLIW